MKFFRFASPSSDSDRRHASRRRTGAGIEALEPRILFATTPAYNFASLLTFNRPVTGGQPEGLVMASDGDLYGVTSNGGAKHDGTIFEIPAGSATLIVLATFTGANGAEPIGNLVLDAQGNLFGTTLHGGAQDLGTIFELPTNDTTQTITTLFTFNAANTGVYPMAGLIAHDGNLFGTTFGRGGFPNQRATVFELVPNGSASTFSVLATFTGPQSYPDSTVIVDGQGNVFGTTRKGGTASDGSIFEVVAGSGTVTTLASFKGKNGSTPAGTLRTDLAGDLFGVTTNGGADNAGTVFQFADGEITTLASFNGTNGARPVGNLMMDGDGNFFGVTATGGAHSTGSIFELPTGTASKLTTIYSFGFARTGNNPSGPLVMDPQGDFFGTTFLGGTLSGVATTSNINGGTVFELLPAAAVLTPMRLVLTETQSGNAIANQPLPKALVAQIEDVFGNVITTDDSDVTLTVNTGPAGAQVSGQFTVAAVNGIATFTNVTLQTAGTYTLVATEGPRVSQPTQSFKISADATSARLVLSTPPANPTLSTATTSSLTATSVLLAPATVEVQDMFGNVIPSYQGKITWSVVAGSGPAGGVLSGTTSLVAAGGKAIFKNLSLTLPANATSASYTLEIMGANLTPLAPYVQEIAITT